MQNLRAILEESHAFSCKYMIQYLKMLIKPCVVGLIGGLFLFLSQLNPIFALAALFITIPCLCYAFWKGFCITYLLNYAALGFHKNDTNMKLSDYLDDFKKDKCFALYITFCAFFSLVIYSPFSYKILKLIFTYKLQLFDIDFLSKLILSHLQDGLSFIVLLILVTILLVPFSNYFSQSYFFKKENENYFSVILNCYKYLNPAGVLIAIVIPLLSSTVSSFQFGAILVILLNPYFYSINTLWFNSRLTKAS